MMTIDPSRIYEPSQIKAMIFEYLMDREEATPPELHSIMKAHVDPSTAAPGIDIMGMIDIMERIYSAKDAVGPVLKTLGAAISTSIAVYQHAAMRERAAGIGQALKREAGIEPPVGMSWPDAADDPDPRPIEPRWVHPLAHVEAG